MSSSNGAIMGVKRGLSLCQNSSPTIENESGTARICTPDDNIHRHTCVFNMIFVSGVFSSGIQNCNETISRNLLSTLITLLSIRYDSRIGST